MSDKALTKTEIMSFKDPDVEIVNAFGGIIGVKVMSGAERDAWESACYDASDEKEHVRREHLRARLLVFCIVDPETRQQLFDADDVEALSAKSGVELDRAYAVAIRINRLRKKDLDDLAKNSHSAPSA